MTVVSLIEKSIVIQNLNIALGYKLLPHYFKSQSLEIDNIDTILSEQLAKIESLKPYTIIVELDLQTNLIISVYNNEKFLIVSLIL